MLRAGIDLGTNSFLLTIAQIDEHQHIKVLEEQLHTVRLGEGFQPSHTIQDEPWKRALEALHIMRVTCDKFNVPNTNIRLAGTSALREASNGPLFVQQAHEQFGFTVELITGKQEALTSWKGALCGLSLPNNASPCLIDIGGGSTEFTWAHGQQGHSLPIGALRAREHFIKNDPPLPSELANLQDATQQLLDTLPKIPSPSPMLAVAGTATTLVAVAHNIAPYDGSLVHGQSLSLPQLQQQMQLFCAVPLTERQKIPGLAPSRADIIIPGLQILLTALDHLNTEHILVSDRGIRFGLLL